MSDRPHSMLAQHYHLPQVFTMGHKVNGFAPQGCLACREDPHYLELVDILLGAGDRS